MLQPDRIRLQHMLDAANEARSFVSGRRAEELAANRMLLLALLKDLEIIGEAAAALSPDCRESTHTLPWAEIIGMRHRLVHGYFDINLNIVWRTIQDDLPPLILEIQRVLGESKDQ